MKSFQHQDTETSSAVNHNIYKRTFLLLPVENQFVPYCWCLTPNFVCWLPLPSKQFKVQRRPHIVGRCINSTNIRWYVCASFTVGQYLCINRLFSLGTLDLFISQIFIFSFINFPSFLILLISVLWLANDWLSSHLSFLFFNPRLIFNVPFLLLLLYLLFFTFTLGLFSYLPFTITFQFIDCLPSILLPYSWTHLLLPSSLFSSDIESDSSIQAHSESLFPAFTPFWDVSSTVLPKLFLTFLSFSPACDSSSTLLCYFFPRCASVLMLVEIY